MLDKDDDISLIEFNTISSAIGPLSDRVKLLQEYVNKKYRQEHVDTSKIDKGKIVGDEIVSALSGARDLYEKKGGENTIILFINEDNVQVVSDIRVIWDKLIEEKGIEPVSLTMDEVANGAVTVDPATGVLTLTSTGQEVSLVYYRTGYVPQNYPGKAYDGRLILEKSAAIKCPSIDLQLMTFKKVQEKLGTDEVWAKAFGSELQAAKPIFEGKMWGFEDLEAVRSTIEDCKVNPGQYVLKTQREGGGNNYFGSAIIPLLEKEDELWQYSLMKRVFPQSFEATLIRGNDSWTGDSISELGIFGHILFDAEGNELVNEDIGTMMRTKPSTTDEGGVCAGFAYVDCPYRDEREDISAGNPLKL